jgi:hypothetical protein
MVTRLIGGLTPGDGADPRTFPAIFNDAADTIEAQGTAIADLEDLNPVQFGTAVPSDGQVLAFSTAVSAYVPEDAPDVPSNAYFFVETVYFTSSGTFSKADYPWLRAIRVKCVGGGGGGAGAGVNNRGGGGGAGGNYAESFITDIAGLASAVTVTRGAGGAGGAAGSNNGTAGGGSSFGAVVIANGGGGGLHPIAGGAGGSTSASGTGQVEFFGGGGSSSANSNDASLGALPGGTGGSSHLGGAGRGGNNVSTGQDGFAGKQYGGGGGGAYRISANFAGGSGADGLVVVELYA